MSRGDRIVYTKRQLAFISRRRRLRRDELRAAFVKRFRRPEITVDHIRALCIRMGWKGDRRRRRGPMLYGKAEYAFLRRRRALPRRELHAAFIAEFGHEISLHNFKQLCKRNGIMTGRTGHFIKGQKPYNTGKKRPSHPNSKKTQFKKGQHPPNTKYAGYESVTKDGYVQISVNERNPHTGFERRMVLKHKWLWERKHGSVPKGFTLKCKGDRRNTDPDNWFLVPRALLPRLSGRYGHDYDDAPDDLKPTIVAVAQLEQKMFENKGGSRGRSLSRSGPTTNANV
jgi:hypothetical protein